MTFKCPGHTCPRRWEHAELGLPTLVLGQIVTIKCPHCTDEFDATIVLKDDSPENVEKLRLEFWPHPIPMKYLKPSAKGRSRLIL